VLPVPAVSPAVRPLDALGTLLVVALCFSFGFTQVAIKLAIPEIPPLIQSAIRSAGAAIIVALWMRARGISFDVRDGTLCAGIVAGLLFGLEFILIYRGLVWTTATRASLFIYTAPFYVVVGAHWLLPGDRFDAAQWGGLGLSFAGIAVAFGLPTPAADPRQIIGDAMVMGGAIAWAATTIVIKASALNRASPEKTLLYQLVVSGPMLAIAAIVVGEKMSRAPSAIALWSLAYQTIWVVSITFVIWFALILRYSASRVSAFTFLTPLFGVAAGHFVLGEPLTPTFLLAVAMVVGGLILVNRRRKPEVGNRI
jgi:drug/metabolite transporter (DMT)-like permease